MIQHTKERLLFSIALSLLSIIITIFINIIIADEYRHVDGKTKALFGIKELIQFGFQYYVALLGVIALILSIMSFRSNIKRGIKYTSVALSIIALMVVFARIWRFFI